MISMASVMYWKSSQGVNASAGLPLRVGATVVPPRVLSATLPTHPAGFP